MYKRVLSCALSISDPGKEGPPAAGRSLPPFDLSYFILHTS